MVAFATKIPQISSPAEEMTQKHKRLDVSTRPRLNSGQDPSAKNSGCSHVYVCTVIILDSCSDITSDPTVVLSHPSICSPQDSIRFEFVSC